MLIFRVSQQCCNWLLDKKCRLNFWTQTWITWPGKIADQICGNHWSFNYNSFASSRAKDQICGNPWSFSYNSFASSRAKWFYSLVILKWWFWHISICPQWWYFLVELICFVSHTLEENILSEILEDKSRP